MDISGEALVSHLPENNLTSFEDEDLNAERDDMFVSIVPGQDPTGIPQESRREQGVHRWSVRVR